jgi:hypothetical protein
LYSSEKCEHVKENVVGEACSTYGEKINANGFFAQKPVRLRRRWEANINKYLKNTVVGRGLDSSVSV